MSRFGPAVLYFILSFLVVFLVLQKKKNIAFNRYNYLHWYIYLDYWDEKRRHKNTDSCLKITLFMYLTEIYKDS